MTLITDGEDDNADLCTAITAIQIFFANSTNYEGIDGLEDLYFVGTTEGLCGTVVVPSAQAVKQLPTKEESEEIWPMIIWPILALIVLLCFCCGYYRLLHKRCMNKEEPYEDLDTIDSDSVEEVPIKEVPPPPAHHVVYTDVKKCNSAQCEHCITHNNRRVRFLDITKDYEAVQTEIRK